MKMVAMPDEACLQIPDNIQQLPYYDIAMSEVNKVIPAVLIDMQEIHKKPVALYLDDVRKLMVLCWMRGAAAATVRKSN